MMSAPEIPNPFQLTKLNFFSFSYFCSCRSSCVLWNTYEATSLIAGCVKTSENTSLRVDCNTLKVQQCQDFKCVTNCTDDDSYDYAKFKNCTDIGDGTYSKAFCGVLSSPYPQFPQVQVREYGPADPNNTCTVPMTSNTGILIDKCVLMPNIPGYGSKYGKVYCNNQNVTAIVCTNSTCTECDPVELPVDCLNRISIGCGVGSASGLVVSMVLLGFSAIFFVFAMF
jgi:hypothetical protein